MTPSIDPPAVIQLTAADAREATRVFCDAFREYETMRYVIGPNVPDYDVRLERLVSFFLMARVLRGEPFFGVRTGNRLAAVATTSDPMGAVPAPDLSLYREACWEALGAGARDRYDRCGEIWNRLAVAVPRVHLNMIGVIRTAQGQGLASRLLDRVHRLARETPGAVGVSLTTESPQNVPLYQRAGYAIVGHAAIEPGFETWSFFRRNDS